MQHLRNLLLVAIAVTVAAPVFAAGGSSAGGSAPTQTRVKRTPEQSAVSHYNRGLKRRDKGEKYLLDAMGREGKARAKREKKAAKQFEKAAKEFDKAIGYRADFYQAHGSLGYAYRQLGHYDQSLVAYNRSLSINPDYGEAIEYRAEAYLGLNQMDAAQQAYMDLFRRQRDLADQLMVAMNEWVGVRRSEPAGLAPDRVEAFAAWVAQRAELADQAQPVGAVSGDW
ncbi:MAG: tetratricopeptide repeat protein [Gammaproteobacteria bacterium]